MASAEWAASLVESTSRPHGQECPCHTALVGAEVDQAAWSRLDFRSALTGVEEYSRSHAEREAARAVGTGFQAALDGGADAFVFVCTRLLTLTLSVLCAFAAR